MVNGGSTVTQLMSQQLIQLWHRAFGLVILSLMVGIQACGRISISDDCECGFYTIAGSQRKMHWADGSKIHMQFDEEFPEAQKFAVEAAMSAYNETLSNTKLVIDQSRDSTGDITWSLPASKTGSDPKSVNGDGKNGIYWLTGEWPWKKQIPIPMP